MQLTHATPAIRSPRGISLAALRVPLLVKLMGANALVVATLLAASAMRGSDRSAWFVPAFGAFIFVVSVALIVAALRPIRDLETTVSRLWEGDFGARVERSVVADNEVLRVGAMLNLLLDGLTADRARMKALASEVIDVGDRQRAALARELVDSTAQRMAALLLHISAAARDARDPELAGRLNAARDSAAALTNEVRALAQTVHPQVLDDLGLPAALRKLARDASKGSGVDVDVEISGEKKLFREAVSAALYRIAEEAVRNAIEHGAPRRVHVSLGIDESLACLAVRDDGRGFDLAAFERHPHGTGLASMRDRLLLLDGSLDVRTAVGGGTAIIASIPIATRVDTQRQEST